MHYNSHFPGLNDKTSEFLKIYHSLKLNEGAKMVNFFLFDMGGAHPRDHALNKLPQIAFGVDFFLFLPP
jgi:hypothetical protein